MLTFHKKIALAGAVVAASAVLCALPVSLQRSPTAGIVLSGGPMLDGYVNGQLAGTGLVLWEARRQLAEGLITGEQVVDRVLEGIPSAGHCNSMGTALSMNSLAEALGMSLPGCATIPAPYADRAARIERTHADATVGSAC